MPQLGYHEMLSYGHKPHDDDYREQKEALERAFSDADRQEYQYSNGDSRSHVENTREAEYYSREDDGNVSAQDVEGAYNESEEDGGYRGGYYASESTDNEHPVYDSDSNSSHTGGSGGHDDDAQDSYGEDDYASDGYGDDYGDYDYDSDSD